MRTRMRHAVVAALLVGGPALCSAVLGRTVLTTSVHAQAAQADDAKIWAGVYTAEQAQRGQKAYEAFCTRCHGLDLLGSKNAGSGPALKDANFWVSWERAPLSSILSKIQRTMPYDSPGSLRDDDYTDLLSFILSKNAFPAGKAELAPTDRGGYPRDAARRHRERGSEFRARAGCRVSDEGCRTVAGCSQARPHRR